MDKPPELSNKQYLDSTSREILGECRMPPLGAFSTEEYLQRWHDTLVRRPNSTLCYNSFIIGGNNLIKSRLNATEAQLRYHETAYRVPHAAALELFFRVGYGLVERTVVGNVYIDQAAPDDISAEAYATWLQQPQAERIQEMYAFLEAQDADLLAFNLLDLDGDGGTLMHYFRNTEVNVARVTGDAPYVLSAGTNDDARSELVEGTLAALYLLREHYVAQVLEDAEDDSIFTGELHGHDKPPEMPPDYYIG